MRVKINADLHVQDVVDSLVWGDLILVGHSCGGMVITGAAGQELERLRALIYLNAFVPEESGVSWFARANPEHHNSCIDLIPGLI